MKRNQVDIFLKDVEVPAIVQDKAEEAFAKIRQEGRDKMRKNTYKGNNVKRFIRPIMTVAACAVVVVGASIGINYSRNSSDIYVANNKESDDLKEDNNFNVSFPTFSITAYASEPSLAQIEGSDIIFSDIGIGEGGYTGMMFSIGGDNISDIDISIDKGELYSSTIENTTEDAIKDWLAEGAPDIDNNLNTLTVIEKPISNSDEEGCSNYDKIILYHNTKCGQGIKEKYNSGEYYGFYIPDSSTSVINDETDLAETAHNELNVFDGAVLRITITYIDGSVLTKNYDLSVTKLAQDEQGYVTNKEWTGENEGAFVYGIIAKENKFQIMSAD